MPEVDGMVTINGKQYQLSPLKCKHLRQITKMLENPTVSKTGLFSAIERWMPFIIDSIKTNDPSFTQDSLDEATLQEITAAWTKLAEVSGIKIVTGETKPAVVSTGDSSTGASAAPSAGPIAT